MKRKHTALTWGCALMLGSFVSVVEAGTFKTITIDDLYADWVGVPVVETDAADNVGSVDLAEIQIANDNDFIYIRQAFHTADALSLFTGIDVDENVATGFDVFGQGLIGQEVGWQNDFPFTSGTGVFNDGNGMTGDFFGSGAALLAPFGDVMQRELAIKLDITRNIDGSPVFPDNTVRLLFWTDAGASDVSRVIDYTLAVPEPSSAVLTLLSGCLMWTVRHRR